MKKIILAIKLRSKKIYMDELLVMLLVTGVILLAAVLTSNPIALILKIMFVIWMMLVSGVMYVKKYVQSKDSSVDNIKVSKQYSRALKDYYIGNEKKPSIKKGQKWLVDGMFFSEEAERIGFHSTWVCKRLGTEVYLHKEEVIETFGVESLESIGTFVEFLCEYGNCNTVLTECRSYGGLGSCLTCGQLKLNVT